MQTFFVKTHAWDTKAGQWRVITSCTTAENEAKAHDTVKRHLNEGKYHPVLLAEIRPA